MIAGIREEAVHSMSGVQKAIRPWYSDCLRYDTACFQDIECIIIFCKSLFFNVFFFFAFCCS